MIYSVSKNLIVKISVTNDVIGSLGMLMTTKSMPKPNLAKSVGALSDFDVRFSLLLFPLGY